MKKTRRLVHHVRSFFYLQHACLLCLSAFIYYLVVSKHSLMIVFSIHNVFTGVCLSMVRMGGMLGPRDHWEWGGHVWSQVPSGVSQRMYARVGKGWICQREGSGQYASYWKAFLYCLNLKIS